MNDPQSGTLLLESDLTCTKCHTENAPGAAVCVECGRHLLVHCRHCGHPNDRANARCTECRTQLHWRWPARWKPARARKWVRPVEIFVATVAVLLTVKGIILIAEMRTPERPTAPVQPVFVVQDRL
ncbi:MAG: zinc ribbon domain-containing protein [Verrucomicrobiota bacterium]